MFLSCIYIQDKLFCSLPFFFFDSIHVEARGNDGRTYGEKEKIFKSKLPRFLLLFPAFSKGDSISSSMFPHATGSSTELPFSALINPDAVQHVLGVHRGYHDRNTT